MDSERESAPKVSAVKVLNRGLLTMLYQKFFSVPKSNISFITSGIYYSACLVYELNKENNATVAVENILSVYREIINVSQCQGGFKSEKWRKPKM